MERIALGNLLTDADGTVLRRWADRVAATAEIQVVEEPAAALVHMQARDGARGVPFFLGEVLITRCRVLVNGAVGFGTALGEDAERSLCTAILDGALQIGHPLGAEIAAELERDRSRQQGQETTLVRRTRVRFQPEEG